MSNQKHTVKLTVEGKAAVAGMVRDVEGSMGRVNKSVDRLSSALKFALGAGGLALIVQQNALAARESLAWAKALDINVESLTANQYAAREAGIEAEKMADILKDTSEKIADAYRNNAGPAVDILNKLNLSVSDMVKLAPDQQLLKIAGAFDQVGTHAEKLQILEELASDSSKLLPLLDNNAERFRELTERAIDLGYALNQTDAQSLLVADSAIRDLTESFKLMGRELSVAVAPEVSGIIRKLAVGIPKAIGFVQSAWRSLQGDMVLNQIEDAQERLNDLFVRRNELESKHAQILMNKNFRLKEYDETNEEIDQLLTKIAQLTAEFEQLKNPPKIVIDAPIIDTGVSAAGATLDDQTEVDRFAQQFDRMRESLLTQRELLNEDLFEREMMVEDGFQAGFIRQTERNQMLLSLQADHEKKMTALIQRSGTDREKFQILSTKNQTKHVVGELANLTAGVAQHSKKAFQLNKAAGISMALINTYEGVTKSLAAYPQPLAGIMAAAHFAAGMAQVNAIRSQTFNGGGAGTAPSATGISPAQPVTPIPPTNNNAGQAEPGKVINVYLDQVLVGDDRIRDVVVDAINEAEANDEVRIKS